MTHADRVARNLEFARVLAAIAGCPDRGSVLPTSLQPECGCAELSECRAGKGRGREPGQVTTADCMRCKSVGDLRRVFA
jgi:hypothetical protein